MGYDDAIHAISRKIITLLIIFANEKRNEMNKRLVFEGL